MGPQAYEPAATVGDFVVWTKRGQPSYQLAVVVDDHRQGVTQVVRGNDLLDSAARQLLLYRALGYSPEPAYTHLPLVRGADGRRLAKRHGDTRVEHYRGQGVGAERVIGLIAWWCGVEGAQAGRLCHSPEPMSTADFVDRFRLDTMSRSDVTFRPEDDAWLRSRS
jgi:glutamyl-tRNA synthetase